MLFYINRTYERTDFKIIIKSTYNDWTIMFLDGGSGVGMREVVDPLTKINKS